MSYDPPTPENNVILRQMEGMRREMREMMERNARITELQHRMIRHVDEGMERMREDLAYVRRDMKEIKGDLVLMENRILDAISRVQNLSADIDDMHGAAEASTVPPKAHG